MTNKCSILERSIYPSHVAVRIDGIFQTKTVLIKVELQSLAYLNRSPNVTVDEGSEFGSLDSFVSLVSLQMPLYIELGICISSSLQFRTFISDQMN